MTDLERIVGFKDDDRQGRVRRIIHAVNNRDFTRTKLPKGKDLAAIEARGYDHDGVQAYVSRLELTGDSANLMGAAMLRGAFNDLLGQIEGLQTPSEPASE